jgi:hypothetical protein
MKTVEDTLKLELDTWDDPGDYPSNAGSGPLPSYTFVLGVEGKVVVELEDDDTVELPIDVAHVQAYVDDNPGEVKHDVAGLTVAKWVVEKVDGKRVELVVANEEDGAFEAECPPDDDYYDEPDYANTRDELDYDDPA